ncbi:MAG TPA: oxygenase MpaB family protein [Solirubrobacteraceae bacterium]|nr:oxygenase MpaB family protein [Solirubrobacteraceae bacterium]
MPDPASLLWRRGSDARVMLAAGYALLLQVAHPTVGAGVTDHSSFRRDPWGRLLRTLDFTCTMVYGGPGAAREMGRRIRAMHVGIKGRRPDGRSYDALEPDAYAWVHATLAEGIVAAHERFGRPLAPAERQRLWAEWRSLGDLLGVDADELPVDWSRFRDYFDAMTRETLAHTAAVDEVLDALARPVPPALAALYRPIWPLVRMPAGHLIGLATAGLLPPQLRVRLGVPWGRRRAAELGLASAALRAATPLMPQALRITGPGYLQWRAGGVPR